MSSERKTLKQLGPWLSHGEQFLDEFSNKNFRSFLREETGNLAVLYFADSPERLHEIKQKIRRHFRDIVELALELDAMFMSSKAIIGLSWDASILWAPLPLSKPTILNQTTMLDRTPPERTSQSDRIDFVISPLLFKIGNADGKQYESSLYLAKSGVVRH